MKNGGGYHYYKSSNGTTGLDPEGIRGAQQLGQYYLNSPLSNLDYLVDKKRTQILAEWFGDLDESGLSVLDVGGRIQRYRPLLESRIEHYVAVDLQLEGLVDVLATAVCLPFGEDTFDIVLCSQVLHYVPDPGLAINEMHRVLRPGGKLFLTTPSLFPEHHDHLWRFLRQDCYAPST
jgi:SAM-dependent methyltransferase